MSDRSIIWLRDALVISLSVYVVASMTIAPWSDLKSDQVSPTSCGIGCPPLIVFPEDGYYHYKESLTFVWNPVSVSYNVIVSDKDSDTVVIEENLTDITSITTSRLPPGNYSSSVYYLGLGGTDFGNDKPLLYYQEYYFQSAKKLSLEWDSINVTYFLEIRQESDSGYVIIEEVGGISTTSYDYADFDSGKRYSWSVMASDSLNFDSAKSEYFNLNVGTTKFLAFELFSNWTFPFILLGVLMVIALQAGVFLAREENDD